MVVSQTKKRGVRGWLYGSHSRAKFTVISLIAIVAIWEAFGYVGQIDPLFFTWPSGITRSFIRTLESGELARNFIVSMQEFIAGFILAIVAGIPLGILMGRFRTSQYLVEPYLTALYAAPLVAFMPLLILWFGIGLGSKIAIVFLLAFFPLCFNAYEGTRSVDPYLVEAAISFGATERRLFVEVVIPSVLPFIVAGLRLAIGRGLIAIFVGEMFAATAGIGFMIVNAGAIYDTGTLMAGVLVLMALGVFLTESMKRVERRVAPWQFRAEE